MPGDAAPMGSGQPSLIEGDHQGGAATFESEAGKLIVLPSITHEPVNLTALPTVIRCNLNVHNIHSSAHMIGTMGDSDIVTPSSGAFPSSLISPEVRCS